jgi:hypothetical protein
MRNEQTQLELLDEMVANKCLGSLNLQNPYREWNYSFLLRERFAEVADGSGQLKLTDAGEKLRDDLRRQFWLDEKQTQIVERLSSLSDRVAAAQGAQALSCQNAARTQGGIWWMTLIILLLSSVTVFLTAKRGHEENIRTPAAEQNLTTPTTQETTLSDAVETEKHHKTQHDSESFPHIAAQCSAGPASFRYFFQPCSTVAADDHG